MSEFFLVWFDDRPSDRDSGLDCRSSMLISCFEISMTHKLSSPLTCLLFYHSSTPSTPVKLKSLATVKAHDKDINALDIAPNGRLVATGSQDKTAKVFEVGVSTPLIKLNSQTHP
jgi:WD40 repeat protein